MEFNSIQLWEKHIWELDEDTFSIIQAQLIYCHVNIFTIFFFVS